jgi:acetyl esterase/lipase
VPKAIRKLVARVVGFCWDICDLFAQRKGSDGLPVTTRRDVNLPGAPIHDALDLHFPSDAAPAELPLLVLIHGGGLFHGDKVEDDAFARQLAARGFTVASLNYPLAPHASVAEQVASVRRNLAWLEANYPNQAGIVAESGGALPAVLVAVGFQSDPVVPVPVPKRLVLVSPMLEIAERSINGFGVRLICFGAEDRDVLEAVKLEKLGLRSLPPTLVVSSEQDWLGSMSQSFTARLDALGVEHQYLRYGKPEHGRLDHIFAVRHPTRPESQEVLEAMADWFRVGSAKQ